MMEMAGVPLWIWGTFLTFVLAMLALDLGVFHRHAHKVEMREAFTWSGGALLLLQEAGGGILFGLVLGWVTFYLLRSIDHYHVEVLLTLAAVMGGYALASHLHQ